ncbi:RHS domain-containing protein [Pseudomonas lini]
MKPASPGTACVCCRSIAINRPAFTSTKTKVTNPWPASTVPARCKKIRYYHNDLNGLPEQLTEADGHNVWQATYRVWGNTLEEVREPYYIEEQNLRFQGQYLDRETGLHFNTFRFL